VRKAGLSSGLCGSSSARTGYSAPISLPYAADARGDGERISRTNVVRTWTGKRLPASFATPRRRGSTSGSGCGLRSILRSCSKGGLTTEAIMGIGRGAVVAIALRAD
jgi:hypothetical protein